MILLLVDRVVTRTFFSQPPTLFLDASLPGVGLYFILLLYPKVSFVKMYFYMSVILLFVFDVCM